MTKTKLKIITGNLKNYSIDSPRSGVTHPMSERIRGAIFNALGDISNLSILDAYAGSGTLGIESISRGAKKAILLENDSMAIKTIKQTIDNLKLNKQVQLFPIDNLKWLELNNDTFDIIFLDPPYSKVNISSLLTLANIVTEGGVIVVSVPTLSVNQVTKKFKDFILIKKKSYGRAQVLFFRK